MKVHEFQAKEIFRKHGVPVPQGQQVQGPEETARFVDRVGGKGVVKAQIYAGGRGKAGGVKLVRGKDEAEAAFRDILGMTLISPQTGPEGKVVNKVMVEEALDIKSEFYLSLLVDRATARLAVMASAAGGMDIEEVAATQPEKIIAVKVDPIIGFSSYLARELAFGLGLDPALLRSFQALVANLIKVFKELDASMIEINPLVLTGQGELIAADAKFTFDDNALFRHKEIAELADRDEADPLEWEAKQSGLNYIRLDGQHRGHGQRSRAGHGHHGPDQTGRGRTGQLPGRGRRSLQGDDRQSL